MKTKTTHTPGPWKVYLPSDAQKVSPFFAVHAPAQDLRSSLANGLFTLAHVEPCDGGEAVQEANARLIAAAPDLLAALKAMIDRDDGRENPDSKRAHSIAHEAIDKAEGR